MNLPGQKVQLLSVGLFSFLVLATVSGLSTTYSSRPLLVLVRLAAIAMVIVATMVAAMTARLPRGLALSVVTYTSLMAYAGAVGFINGGIDIVFKYMFMDFTVPLCGLLLLGSHFFKTGLALPEYFSPLFIRYTLLYFVTTVILGGFHFSIPPGFVFEVYSEVIGTEAFYNLQLTFFFGVASVLATIQVTRERSKLGALVYLSLLLLFLCLTILAGGRGELIATFAIVILIFIVRRPLLFLGTALMSALGLYSLIGSWASFLDSLVTFQRFTDLFEGNLSQRDVIFQQSIDLIVNEPWCLISGGGAGFFQHYYGYEFGMYPHNSVIEATIIFGLPILAVIGLLVVHGMIRYYKLVGQADALLVVFLYSFLVSLKSGHLFGAWVVVATSFFFISLSLQPAINKRKHYPEQADCHRRSEPA